MKIEINDHRRIFALQRDFSGIFPYLQLEFFAKPHTTDGKPSVKLIKHPAKSLGTCRTNHKRGMIEITPSMTVRELEETFRDVYGLSVQVMRKSGSDWIETMSSDGWSLRDQNEKGGVTVESEEHAPMTK